MPRPKPIPIGGKNLLFYGDNLPVLREHFPDECVDLIYLDPPFNSNRSYNVLFKSHSGTESQAQIEAFDDSWHWSQQAEAQFLELMGGGAPGAVVDAISAMRQLLGTNDVLAYLTMMTARFLELHRVLKPTGSLYLHCDPTASHYLKVMLDSIFGPTNFRNEIVWKRTAAKGSPMGRLPANHDIILSYSKTASATWKELILGYDLAAPDAKTLSKYSHVDPDGRRYRLGPLLHPEQGKRPNLEYEVMGVTKTWRWSKDRMEQAIRDGLVVQTAPGRVPQSKLYLDEQKGRTVDDVWTDIAPLNSQAAERLGYPTQKPLALLERILAASSNEGDIVLDAFCGCGTAVDAAQKLHRRWIGIDITYLAVDLIRKRMRHTYGDEIEDKYEVHGIPADVDGAAALFAANAFDFERWAVSLLDGQPNEKQVGDKGIDGIIRFYAEDQRLGRAIISVKGGGTNPNDVNALLGTVQKENAELGVFVMLGKPTKGMQEVCAKSGNYQSELTGQSYPRLQIATIEELMAGKRPKLPTAILPYVKAAPRPRDQQALDL